MCNTLCVHIYYNSIKLVLHKDNIIIMMIIILMNTSASDGYRDIVLNVIPFPAETN